MHLMLSWLSCVFRNLGFRSVSRISGAESFGHPFFFLPVGHWGCRAARRRRRLRANAPVWHPRGATAVSATIAATAHSATASTVVRRRLQC